MTSNDPLEVLLDGFTEPRPFVPDTISNVPDEPGVHVVWGPEPEDGIVYVGQTSRLRTRLRQHLSGGRQSSVLCEQVGELLDGDQPDSADRDAIQEWLGLTRVAWRVEEARVQLKRRLVDAVGPRFNRLRIPPEDDSGIWWINQGRSYDAERDGWVVFAGTDRPDGGTISHHESLARMRAGHVTLHYAGGFLRALGVVHAAGVRARRPHGPIETRDVGLAVRVEYFPLDEPVALDDLPGERERAGPFDRNEAVRQGYCFPLSHAWAETLRDEYDDRWPAGSPWSGEERSYWVFQAQPDQWNLVEHLPEMLPGTNDTWTASKNRSRMRAGDAVVLWSGGAQAGVYALARLTGEPALEDRPEFRPESVGDQEWRVPLVVTAHVDPPLLKAQAQADSRLSGLSVIRPPGLGPTNPRRSTSGRQSSRRCRWRNG